MRCLLPANRKQMVSSELCEYGIRNLSLCNDVGMQSNQGSGTSGKDATNKSITAGWPSVFF
jgi:hypothetical protein